MHCNFCEWKCDLGTSSGICKMYHQVNGRIEERFPDRWSSYMVSKIESVPFYHAYPGSRSMVVGTMGCNFNCSYCSNSFVACQNPEHLHQRMFHMDPRALVEMAQKLGCHNIVFNVNEPTVSLPTLARVKKHADKAGIPMGCLTNAYTTRTSTKILADIFSFINIGLKGFTSAFYKEYTGIPSMEPILRNIDTLARRCHVEIITPVIQDVNDKDLDLMALFIARTDPEIPWHVFRLLPERQMKDSRYPDITTINNALEHARTLLPYVYFHNFVGSDWVNTPCPGCRTDVITRFSLGCGGDRLDQFLCDNNQCPECGHPIKLLGGKIPWNLPKEGN